MPTHVQDDDHDVGLVYGVAKQREDFVIDPALNLRDP
jgi:hypothetical protein